MKLDKELILKIASIARLNLTEEEINEFLPELKAILEYFSNLDKVDTKDVKPSFQPTEMKNVYRQDKVEKCLTQEEALANAKHKKDGYFIGPKAI